MQTKKHEKARQGVLPAGCVLCPDAVEALERALSALRSGLLAPAWFWTEMARLELDAVTEGQGVEGQGDLLTGE